MKILSKIKRQIPLIAIFIIAFITLFVASDAYSTETPPDTCPLIDELRVKYSQCWACPVLNQLVRSFVDAAIVALDLSKEAGIFLLKFGSLLWILIWGLRHVSSMAQVEPANILAELIKFLFKVMLAYAFILGGIRFISTYFTNPIMGLGAKIAENLWEEERIKPNTYEYVWADISEESQKELDDNIEQERENYEEQNGESGGGEGQSGEGGEGGSQTSQEGQESEPGDVSEPEAPTEPEKKPYNGDVPPFIIPPVSSGTITSPAGCRFHPVKKEWIVHKGLDIGGNNGVTIVASADGQISYKADSGDMSFKKGYGCYAIITHADGWSSVYAHMPAEVCTPMPSSRNVKKGDTIGKVGNTGTSTGPHLHFEVRKNNRAVEPLHLLAGEILYIDGSCNADTGATPFPFGMNPGINVAGMGNREVNSEQFVEVTPSTASNSSDNGDNGGNSGGSGSGSSSGNYGNYTPTYTGGQSSNYSTTVILSDSIINSMLGAASTIGTITSENMILGEAVMCFAKQDKGGAWHLGPITVTNLFMFLEGVFIWVTGLLLTMAYAFYLIDIAFKIGFAIIAMPIAFGLWPFELTKDKLGVCISIIAKAAATFAFLAITTSFTVHLSEATYNYEENETAEGAEGYEGGVSGLAKLYATFDKVTQEGDSTDLSEDIDYASEKLAFFSTTFVLLLFSFLYSFKLVRKTIPDLVNKFFPDKAFGDASPMHQWATAVAQKAKDIAMVPVGYARDITMYQGGKLANKVSHKVGKGATKAVQGVGKGVQAAGKGISAAGKGLQAVPVVGNVVGGAIMGVGKLTEVAGKAVEVSGKVAEKTNDAVHKASNKKDDKKTATDKPKDNKETKDGK